MLHCVGVGATQSNPEHHQVGFVVIVISKGVQEVQKNKQTNKTRHIKMHNLNIQLHNI